MDECTPTYYIVIPTHILSDLNVSQTAKLLYGVIDSFQRRTGVCFATNDRLAQELANCDKRTVSRAISELKDAGHIVIDNSKEPGKKKCRKIYLTVSSADGQGVDKIVYGVRQNCLPTHDKIVNQVNNKSKKESINPLDVFVSWIQEHFCATHSADDKNKLFLHLKEYAEMRKESKSPLNTKRKVDGLLEDLLEQSGGNLDVMCEMLKKARRMCWLSVHSPNDNQKTSPVKTKKERVYEEL